MKKKQIIALALVVIVAVAMVFAYQTFSEKSTEGKKSITIEVVNSAEKSTVYEVNTEGEYLIDALKDADGLTYSGYEGEYGYTVTEINGEVADFSTDSSYWSFYVNGNYCNYSISQQPVNDGDKFQIIYATY